jgi:ABC-type uncharacterized transport system YnjBCD permease subunit
MFIFTTSTVVLRSNVLPSWLAVVGFPAGLVMFVMPFVSLSLGCVLPAWGDRGQRRVDDRAPSTLDPAAESNSDEPDATPLR